MRFVYCYKTSDGIRHEGEIDARSNDAAFATLRAQGIRPIRLIKKVDPFAAARRRRWAWGAVCGLLLAAIGIAVFEWIAIRRADDMRREAERARYREDTREAFTALKLTTEGLVKGHRAQFATVNFGLLRNYALLAQSADVTPFYSEIEKGRNAVIVSRERAKSLFKDVYSLFPPESVNERLDAQRLYGDVMEMLDADEGRVDAAEYALTLLDAHRDAWRVDEKRQIVFTDSALAGELKFSEAVPDAGTVRWRRDFGGEKKNEKK